MSLYNGPARGGNRGGKDQFNWEGVKSDPDREFYLGHSVKASTGRWQKNKDPFWYTRSKEGQAQTLQEELTAIKAREEELMLEAMGIKPKSKPVAKQQLEAKEVAELMQKARGEHDDEAGPAGGGVDHMPGLGFSSEEAAAAAGGGASHEVLAGVGVAPAAAAAAPGGGGQPRGNGQSMAARPPQLDKKEARKASKAEKQAKKQAKAARKEQKRAKKAAQKHGAGGVSDGAEQLPRPSPERHERHGREERSSGRHVSRSRSPLPRSQPRRHHHGSRSRSPIGRSRHYRGRNDGGRSRSPAARC